MTGPPPPPSFGATESSTPPKPTRHQTQAMRGTGSRRKAAARTSVSSGAVKKTR